MADIQERSSDFTVPGEKFVSLLKLVHTLLLALIHIHIHIASHTRSSPPTPMHHPVPRFLLLHVFSNTPSTSVSVMVCTFALLPSYTRAHMHSCLHLCICAHNSCSVSLQGCCQLQLPAIPRMT